MARLTDLPTETLVQIFEDPLFPSDTLCALALTCRRLHLITFSVYFARHGIDGTPHSILVRMRVDRRYLLATLQMARFIPEIEDFTFIFPHPSCLSIFPLLRHLRRVQNYIARLPSVQKVTLQLDDEQSQYLAVGGPRALRDWATHLEGLLNCIVSKGCTSLTMRYGNQMTKPSPKNASPISRLLTSLRRRRVGMSPPSSPSHSYKLQALTIRSSILIINPGRDWTLAMLKHSQIASLTLGRGMEEAGVWTAALPQIASAARSLPSLTILDADLLPPTDILEFIFRLPFLEHLAIASRRDTESRPLPGPISPLDTLQRCEHPHFQSICILWPDIYDPAKVGVLGVVFGEIMDTVHTRGLSPTFSISCSSGIAMFRANARAQYSSGGFPSLLQQTTAVEIPSITGGFWAADLPDVTAWIALCPRLRRVDITLLKSSNVAGAQMAQALEPTEYLNKVTVNGVDYALVKGGEVTNAIAEEDWFPVN
ncbi:hypothetical protein B0H16DRAFT_1878495 [Mycena metata]|uniref:F-box domain-containing protein n=1 Tax=Mycena metata TaxID=1033252 RepID=A0AAD7K7L1_9AGAR|nr:hypothetical protein B0H16DRAFT_1878495 [Mycena metata]